MSHPRQNSFALTLQVSLSNSLIEPLLVMVVEQEHRMEFPIVV